MRRFLLLVLALTLLGLPACSHENDADSAPEPARASDQPEWQRLPDFPLAERAGPVVVWTGSEVLAVGGEIGDSCPPGADCAIPYLNESATDGAAFDPATRTWRRIADAPVQIPAYNRGVVVGGQVFIRVDESLLAYDIAADRWKTFPRHFSGWYDLVVDGDRVVFVSGSDERGKRPDLVYEPGTGAWSELPDDPLGPSFGRSMVSTQAGLLLGAQDLVPSPGGGDQPSYLEAALLDRRTGVWRVFGPSDRVGDFYPSTQGNVVVTPTVATSNGGGDWPGDYGREIPYGGRLNVHTGEWSALEDPPTDTSGGWGVHASTGRLVTSGPYVYDDATGAWIRIPDRPNDASDGPGPAVWAGEELIVITGNNMADTNAGARSNEAWSWTPVLR